MGNLFHHKDTKEDDAKTILATVIDAGDFGGGVCHDFNCSF